MMHWFDGQDVTESRHEMPEFISVSLAVAGGIIKSDQGRNGRMVETGRSTDPFCQGCCRCQLLTVNVQGVLLRRVSTASGKTKTRSRQWHGRVFSLWEARSLVMCGQVVTDAARCKLSW